MWGYSTDAGRAEAQGSHKKTKVTVVVFYNYSIINKGSPHTYPSLEKAAHTFAGAGFLS